MRACTGTRGEGARQKPSVGTVAMLPHVPQICLWLYDRLLHGLVTFFSGASPDASCVLEGRTVFLA